ncbi:hypothetical protein DBV15_08544 [Temnothorax longispinosus]|uniref:Uncharacterized protein n=1 Tax=Temnothorax longispinosus TaxID=300112 RepID=A0A4S2KTJ4_9HYME|nr:hypothetical protein DBV15_08544 [Temnothorax longispinosus]
MQLRELKTYVKNRKRFLDADFFEKLKSRRYRTLRECVGAFLRGHELRNVDYRDFPFSVIRTHRVLGPAVAVAVGTLVPHRDDLNVRPVITSREIMPRRIILLPGSLGARGMAHAADDSPIIRSPLKFDLITERDRTRRRRRR